MKISIVIRTKNEERWIVKCIDALKKQSIKNFEIILVDNNSADRTVEKARANGVKKIVTINKFLPGKALNLGIEKSNSEYIVCLSAHCIPKNKLWLKNLLKNIENKNNVAGVYGRQEPMEFSSDSDKRDLFLVFGLDKKIQIKDSFFHNANSIISRKVWKKINFDNKISNIEDRIWGQKVISKGYKIIYEPEASVYHYHGIHQSGNKQRLKNVVNIIQSGSKTFTQGNIDPSNLNILAMIPSRGKPKKFKNKNLIDHTIKHAKKSKFVNKIFVLTDNDETKNISIKSGAECPFLRPKKLSSKNINLRSVQKYSLDVLESKNIYPDLIVHLEETYPFRDRDIIDNSIKILLKNGYDTVIAAKEEKGWIWQEKESTLYNITKGDMPSKIRKKTYLGLHGVCCITYPEFIRDGSLFGKKIGLYIVKNNMSPVEIRDASAYKKFYNFIKNQ